MTTLDKTYTDTNTLMCQWRVWLTLSRTCSKGWKLKYCATVHGLRVWAPVRGDEGRRKRPASVVRSGTLQRAMWPSDTRHTLQTDRYTPLMKVLQMSCRGADTDPSPAIPQLLWASALSPWATTLRTKQCQNIHLAYKRNYCGSTQKSKSTNLYVLWKEIVDTHGASEQSED